MSIRPVDGGCRTALDYCGGPAGRPRPASATYRRRSTTARSGPAAVQRCRSLLTDADLPGEAAILTFLSGLEATRGRFGEARRLVDRAEALYDDLGETALAHGNCGTVRGQIELLGGDPAAAERALARATRRLAAMGDRAYLATRAAELAEAVTGTAGSRRRRSDRDRPGDRGRRRRPDPVPLAGRARQGVRTTGSSRRGRKAGAEGGGARRDDRRAEPAAPSCSTSRRCSRRSGRADEAAAAAARALDLFEQKGNVVEAGRARALAVA